VNDEAGFPRRQTPYLYVSDASDADVAEEQRPRLCDRPGLNPPAEQGWKSKLERGEIAMMMHVFRLPIGRRVLSQCQ